MDKRAELGEFLRSRRARLRPEDVGLDPLGVRRRVSGLRREELAQLAGISVDYYVRLEQGRSRNISGTVLDAVARALRLDESERTHLRNLAQPVRRSSRASQPQHVRPALRQLLGALHDVPAFVFGRRLDVLTWNRLACALIADFDAMAPTERNLARLVFLDDSARTMYPDWEHIARDTVGNLRLYAGRNPEDPHLANLVGELSVKSEEFRHYWANHNVRDKTHGTKRFEHPIVGPLTLSYETLWLGGDSEQALMTYAAEPESESEASLRLLASWTAQVAESTPGPSARHSRP